MKSAVAIGGAAAFAACVDRGGTPDVPQGPDDPSTLPARQHAWNDALSHDDYGNALPPRHQLLLFFEYAGDGTPTDGDRETVEGALRSLERAYARHHGDDVGLLFTVGYSPAYFDRFESGPAGVDLPKPKPLSSFETPELDTQDVVVHLASDHAQVVLAAEQALLGEKDSLNGVDVESSFDGVLEKADRRSGFVGDGLPAENQDVAGIPDSEPVPTKSPLYMGFKSGFTKNQASQSSVTITDGPFSEGTTQHVSHIQLQLDQWYEQDSREQRVAKMFCPVHAEENLVEGTGENLGDESKMDGECIDDVPKMAREKGVVGHSQKSALARRDGSPVILRRDFDSTDGGEAGLHFVAHQRTIGDFVDTRNAMNGEDLASNAGVGQKNNNGILQYMSVKRRGNWLLPPREKRALPGPK